MSVRALPLLVAMGCTGGGIVEVAAENTSTFDFSNVVFHVDIDWGDLAAGEQTDFFDVEEAYSYTYVSFDIDGVAFVLQPIDYVGETPLDPGQYVYDLAVDDATSGVVSLTLRPL